MLITVTQISCYDQKYNIQHYLFQSYNFLFSFDRCQRNALFLARRNFEQVWDFFTIYSDEYTCIQVLYHCQSHWFTTPRIFNLHKKSPLSQTLLLMAVSYKTVKLFYLYTCTPCNSTRNCSVQFSRHRQERNLGLYCTDQ